jgi:hypothetical protein
MQVFLLLVVFPFISSAASILLEENFRGTKAPDWTLTNSAQLTAATGIDPAGSGFLRLTSAQNNQVGFAFNNTAVPFGYGLDIQFRYAIWGGTGADGIALVLFDGDTTPTKGGAYGGSLGYAQRTGVAGLAGGILGIGLDEFGNFANPTEGRQGGPGFIKNTVTIRGPGDGTANAKNIFDQFNYAYLTSSGRLPEADLMTSSRTQLALTGPDAATLGKLSSGELELLRRAEQVESVLDEWSAKELSQDDREKRAKADQLRQGKSGKELAELREKYEDLFDEVDRAREKSRRLGKEKLSETDRETIAKASELREKFGLTSTSVSKLAYTDVNYREARIVVDTSQIPLGRLPVTVILKVGQGATAKTVINNFDAYKPVLAYYGNDPARIPRTLKFGFTGSTGGSTNNHEIQGLRVISVDDAPGYETVTPEPPSVQQSLLAGGLLIGTYFVRRRESRS